MRFLLDENLPIGLAPLFRAQRHEVDHVKPLGLITASDDRIWERAVADRAIVVTKDADFAGLAGQGARVLWLRMGNCSNAELYAQVLRELPAVMARLEAGETLVELPTNPPPR